MNQTVEDRLRHLVDTRKQAPDSVGKHTDPASIGVTEAWLAQTFRMDQKTVREKLKWCVPKRTVQRGRTMVTRYYDIKDAAAFLVTPAISTQDVLRELKRGQLPPALQQSVWDALLKRQTWEERAGQLWHTDKVREVLGSTFQTIKFTIQLWAETVERQTEMTPEQRELIVKMSDLLMAEIYEALVANAAAGSTGPQLASLPDYVGEDTPMKTTVAVVESDEDDIDYTIEQMV